MRSEVSAADFFDPKRFSVVEQLAMLPQEEWHKVIGAMAPDDIAMLIKDWRFYARPKQITPPGKWNIWLILAGRGWGKTQTGAQWVREQIKNGKRRGALIGPTSSDVRDVMVEGPSGILAAFENDPKDTWPTYVPARRRIQWPNGAVCFTYSAEEPNRLRGPQHDHLWGDEIAAWPYIDAYDQSMFGLRLGEDPQALFTTTPKPVKLVRDLVKRAAIDVLMREGIETVADVVVTKGSTYENITNLAPIYINETVKKYEGTTLGRQELHAEILEDVEGALWTTALIEKDRIASGSQMPMLRRVVVGVDPAVTSKKTSAETGIIVGGVCQEGHGYVLHDGTVTSTPNGWARKAVELYELYGADRVIGETNNGGELVETVIRNVNASVAYKSVNATRGKARRAEPIVAMYEQGKIHHVGYFPLLEAQMTTWREDLGMDSPDRMDALVWTLTELMLSARTPYII